METSRKNPASSEGASPNDLDSNPAQSGIEPESTAFCDICGAGMIQRNCKLVCVNCGFRRDCSDP